eukprot:scaffold47_cov258-Pinguiococcus_pyrenoidosus.AAC.92
MPAGTSSATASQSPSSQNSRCCSQTDSSGPACAPSASTCSQNTSPSAPRRCMRRTLLLRSLLATRKSRLQTLGARISCGVANVDGLVVSSLFTRGAKLPQMPASWASICARR